MSEFKNTKKLKSIGSYIILIVYSLIAIFPLYWLITTSFKPALDVFSPKQLGFFKVSLENYRTVLFNDLFPKYLWNSVIVCVMTVIITMPIGSLAGYAFARLRMKNKDNWFFMVLTTRMAPPVAFAVPLYLLMIKFKLIDTHIGLIAIYIFMNLAFCIWLTRGFFEEIPREIEEAAMVDGFSRFRAFIKFVVPLAKGGLIATAMLIFIFTWNEFFFASILTQNFAKPFTVHLTSFFGSRRILWGELAAASTIGSLIPVFFAIIMRKYIVRGFTMGAIKEEDD